MESEEEKRSLITNYFLNLFRSVGSHNSSRLLNCVERKVSNQMNEELMRDYSKEEVVQTLKSIGNLKAPGPDGSPALFYKEYWEIVGDRIVEEILLLRGGQMPDRWNDTTIVLIPKVKRPENIKDLRPISLCNVLYKLVSKVISNRLKSILPEVVSASQSAFVPGRLITDNILIAYELTHFLKRWKKGECGYAAIKLDMSKAYDRVEWDFFEGNDATTVKYRIRVNGEMTEEFRPERGLRQGDPISLYLFLLCAEGFSVLLSKAEEEGKIHGIRICRSDPSVSHLLFADDSLILCKADPAEALYLKEMLAIYEEESGQLINADKSAVMFSPNTKAADRNGVMEALNIRSETMNEKYLGLPVFVGQSRSSVFAYLKERIWQRIQGWKERLLSRAGKEILIKAVAQAIPVFAMGCFDITKEICSQISAMIARFWWNNQDKEGSMHWIRWEKLVSPKAEGGLGFRDLHSFNMAMLANTGLETLAEPHIALCSIAESQILPQFRRHES